MYSTFTFASLSLLIILQIKPRLEENFTPLRCKIYDIAIMTLISNNLFIPAIIVYFNHRISISVKSFFHFIASIIIEHDKITIVTAKHTPTIVKTMFVTIFVNSSVFSASFILHTRIYN